MTLRHAWNRIRARLRHQDEAVLTELRAFLRELDRAGDATVDVSLLHDIVATLIAERVPGRHDMIRELKSPCLALVIRERTQAGLASLRDRGEHDVEESMGQLPMQEMVLTELKNEVRAALRSLTRAESEVLSLAQQGLTVTEIAAALAARGGRDRSVAEIQLLLNRARLRYRQALTAVRRTRNR